MNVLCLDETMSGYVSGYSHDSFLLRTNILKMLCCAYSYVTRFASIPVVD